MGFEGEILCLCQPSGKSCQENKQAGTVQNPLCSPATRKHYACLGFLSIQTPAGFLNIIGADSGRGLSRVYRETLNLPRVTDRAF